MNREMETLNLPLTSLQDIAPSDDFADLGELQEGEFRGLASAFNKVIDAHIPTVIQRGAFSKTLQERSRQLPILWNHDMDEPIGKPTKMFENEDGLILQAQISRTVRGRDVLTLLRDGVVNSLSIGFEPIQFDFQEDPATGETFRLIREIRLIEVSVVTLPADPNALIKEVRKQQTTDEVDALDTHTTEHEELNEEQDALVEKFAAHVAEQRQADPEATDETIVESFNVSEPTEPSEASLELLHQLREAEILAAQMLID